MALRKRNISRPSAGKAAKKARMRSGRFAPGVGRGRAAYRPLRCAIVKLTRIINTLIYAPGTAATCSIT